MSRDLSLRRERTVGLDEMSEWAQTDSGLVVPVDVAVDNLVLAEHLPTCVDLFSGAGGFSLGMHQAGFHVVAACDDDEAATATYLCNLGDAETVVHFLSDYPKRKPRFGKGDTVRAGDVFEAAGTGWLTSTIDHEPGTCCDHIDDEDERIRWCDTYHASPAHREPCLHYYFGDVTNLHGGDVLDDLGANEVDVVVGGPPCQGFSMANANANPHDPRNRLVFEFGRLVLELNAKSMVMENVPRIRNMLTPEGVPVIDQLCQILEAGDFSTYEGLQTALGGSDTRAGAVRQKQQATGDDDDQEDEEEEPWQQQTMFAE